MPDILPEVAQRYADANYENMTRTRKRCPGCGASKPVGNLVCDHCFKAHLVQPLKYYSGTFRAWVARYGVA